jgi:hypothetical protein
MSNELLNPQFSTFLENYSYEIMVPKLIAHWNILIRERGPYIKEAIALIRKKQPHPPFYCGQVILIEKKINIDFGDKKPHGLATALYCLWANNDVVYDSRRKLFAGPPDTLVIPLIPKEQRISRNLVFPVKKATMLQEYDPDAATLWKTLSMILNPNGLWFVQDTALLLSLVAERDDIDPELLNLLLNY